MAGPSDPRPTMRDVATAAGVSKALVSIAFRQATGVSAQTRERIFAAARSIGYRPNRSASLLARRHTRLLGVTMGVRHPFHAELIELLHESVDGTGYDLVLSAVTRTHPEPDAIEALLEFRCEALVLLGSELSDDALGAIARQLPIVVVGQRVEADGVDVIRSSDALGTALVVDHLAGLGHRRIIHLDGGTGSVARDRSGAYRRAMERHGLSAEAAVISGGASESDGAAAARTLLAAGERPTALVAYNDRCAFGAMDVLRRAGLAVPGDVSVAGYDDTPAAAVAGIDLTSVSQSGPELAGLAVAAALTRLSGERDHRTVSVLEPRLVVRSSTAAPTRA